MHPGSRIGAVYLYRRAVDFRLSIGGLSVLVERELGMNPFGDALYVFVNRRRDRIKALYWHRNGFCLWYKRAAAGALCLAGAQCPLTDLHPDAQGAGVAARRLRPLGAEAA